MKLTPRFEQALVYAARLHAGQVRKVSNVPYLAHLLGTAAIALQFGADEEQAIAALLHDAVEDQGGLSRLAELEKKFGARVAGIVAGCSDSFTQPKPPWRQRKEAYLDQLPDKNKDTLLVSCADKIDNARSILHDYRTAGEALWDRFRGGKTGTLWYYNALAKAYLKIPDFPIANALMEVVAQINDLAASQVSV